MIVEPEASRLLYTVEEAAMLLSISRSQAYKLVGSGELRSVKIGRSRRVPASALRDFVELLSEKSDDEDQ